MATHSSGRKVRHDPGASNIPGDTSASMVIRLSSEECT